MLIGRSYTRLALLSLTLLLLSGAGWIGVEGVQMVERGEAVAVENGMVEAVVLDCPFHQEPGDKFQEMDIKWYHNNSPRPIYQWIPSDSGGPQAMGSFEEVVDVNYTVEGEERPAHRHRALRLINPTTDLNGQYKCEASSFKNYRTHILELVVYRKPKNVSVWTREVERERPDGKKAKAVAVMCMVEDAFPQPSISITHSLVDGGERHQLKGVHPVMSSSQGSYSVNVEGQVFDADLEGLTEFHCQVTINNTDVDVTQHIKYQPSMEVREGAVMGDGSKIISVASALLPLALLVLRWL